MNIEKDKIHDKALELSVSYPALLLSFATGSGKSLAAIKIIDRNQDKKWYIVCKEINHIQNWIEEFKKHKKEYLLDITTFFCYDSLHKYVGTEANLVLDEGHAITELRLELIKQIDASKIIILSATVNEEKKELLRQINGSLEEYHVSISDAIKKGILPPPKVYLIDLELDDSNRSYEHIHNKGPKKLRQIVHCEYKDRYKVLYKHKKDPIELHIHCTAKEKYEILEKNVEAKKKQHFKLQAEWSEFAWLHAGLERKKFLAEYKTSSTIKLLKFLKSKRLICFTGSIEQCNKLGGKYVIHSKNKNNQEIINRFNKQKIDKLFAVNMLRENANLTNIQAGIIVQLDNQKLSFIQMLGRVFRSSLPECYVLVVRGTQDESYLNTVLEGFDRQYIYNFDKSLL